MAIRFHIYKDGKRLEAYSPVNAFMVGPESVPIPGGVSFEDGQLVVPATDYAAGVSLLWPAGEVGTYQLETTRLPPLGPKEPPYILNLELARHHLMKIVQKQEDWNLFDFARANELNDRFRQLQAQFAEALGMNDDPAAAAEVGDAVLAKTIALAEEIADFHADVLLAKRRQTGGMPRHVFGCRIDPQVQNQKYADVLGTSFDYAVLPIDWRQMQPEEDRFDTQAVDGWVEMLNRRRLPILGGPLVDLAEEALPDWMFLWEHDFETFRDMAYEYVRKIATRYRRVVSIWNVIAGVHQSGTFDLTFEQMIELTRLLVTQIKSIVPTARTLITVRQPFGEYHAKVGGGVPPMLYAEMVAQSGINVEAFGLELETGVPRAGSFTRNLFQLSCMLDRFHALGKPLFITCLNAPGKHGVDADDLSEGTLDPAAAGMWHGPWDADRQAAWLEAVCKLALSKPFVESVTWGNLADIRPTVPAGGLLDDAMAPKPAFKKLQAMREHRFANARS